MAKTFLLKSQGADLSELLAVQAQVKWSHVRGRHGTFQLSKKFLTIDHNGHVKKDRTHSRLRGINKDMQLSVSYQSASKNATLKFDVGDIYFFNIPFKKGNFNFIRDWRVPILAFDAPKLFQN